LAHVCFELAHVCFELAHVCFELAHVCFELAHVSIELASSRSSLQRRGRSRSKTNRLIKSNLEFVNLKNPAISCPTQRQ
jgi:hypothetical protein